MIPMKQHRSLTWIAVIVLLVTLTAPLSAAGAPISASERTALVQVQISASEDLTLFEQTGLPAYTRLEGRDGNYLLAGATPAGLEALAAAGLSARVLDPDMAGAAYYLAYPAPNRPRPEWSAYGRLLLDDGEQALLRATAEDARRLALAGAELRMLTLTPKPLRPTVAQNAIPAVVDPDPLVQAMIDQITTDTIYHYLQGFAGDVPVWVDGGWYTITSRESTSGTPILKAAHYLGEQYAAHGLDVEYHVWNAGHGPNVIGQYTGMINPDDIYIIGGHLDDVGAGPGADDNASGTIAGLIAAEVMSQFQWGCTLRFVGWTGEEYGLWGSAAYAQRSYQQGENIVGYLNLDMIAWNTIGSTPGIDLRYSPSIPASLQLAQLFADVLTAYNLNLIPDIGTSLGGGSDHSSFWDYGYNAILGIEDQGDFNPYYHGPGDTVAHTDATYFTNYVKASVATFAHMSGCLIDTGLGALNGHVTAASGGAPIEGATVTAESATGNVLSKTTDATGYYTWTLLTGPYTVTAEAYGYVPETVTGVEVVTGAVTTQDFALEASAYYTISGHVTELGTGQPLLAEVQFVGSPVTVWTDPADGYYEAALPAGSYTIKVQADRHRPEERPIVVVDGNQVQDFELEPFACTLLVDDDTGDTYETYYAGALDAAGVDYELWSVASSGSPTASDLSDFDRVIWFTGDDSSTTLTTDEQAALTAYLNGGGKLFVSGQDIGYDIGATAFYTNYLHAIYDSDDTNNYTLTGLDYLSGVDLTISGGDGAGNQSWPSDISPTGGASAVLDYPSPHLYGGVAYQNSTYGVVYFSFGFEAINNQADRTDVMSRTLAWLGGCQCNPVSILDVTAEVSGCTATYGAVLGGDPPFGYDWDFGPFGASASPAPVVDYGIDGTYPYTLTVSNCGNAFSDTVTGTVTVACCDGVYDAGFTWAPGSPLVGEEVVFTGVASGTAPIEFDWDFGDGTAGDGAVVTHTYALGGAYTVVLTATNTCGEEVVQHQVIVLEPPIRYYIYLPIVVREP